MTRALKCRQLTRLLTTKQISSKEFWIELSKVIQIQLEFDF